MPVGPVGLGQEIINEIDPARAKQRESLFKMRELAWPRVRVNQIELAFLGSLNELRSIGDVKRDSGIRAEMALGYCSHVRLGIDTIQASLDSHGTFWY